MWPAPVGYAALAAVDECKAAPAAAHGVCAGVYPAPVVEYIALPFVEYMVPAPTVSSVLLRPWMSTWRRNSVRWDIAPAHAGSYAVPAPVVEYMALAPVGYTALAPVDECVSLAPAAHTEYAAPAPVFVDIAPALAVSYTGAWRLLSLDWDTGEPDRLQSLVSSIVASSESVARQRPQFASDNMPLAWRNVRLLLLNAGTRGD